MGRNTYSSVLAHFCSSNVPSSRYLLREVATGSSPLRGEEWDSCRLKSVPNPLWNWGSGAFRSDILHDGYRRRVEPEIITYIILFHVKQKSTSAPPTLLSSDIIVHWCPSFSCPN